MSAIATLAAEACGRNSRRSFGRTRKLARAVLGTLALVVGAKLALALVLALLLPGAIRAACAQGPAGGAAAATEPPPAGLYFRAERDDAALEAPRLASRVEIAVGGLISRVTVRQHFVNPTGQWLEGLYVFPLPERAAVDRLTMTVGGRPIEGRIMERAEAQKTYEDAARAGKRASLLSAERANFFTTAVANIGPGEEIVVEIEYQDRVRYANGRFSLRFPMVVAPRYTPPGSAPLAGRPGPRPAALDKEAGRDLFGPVRHPARGPANPVTLAVALDAGLPIAEVESLYHPVEIAAPDARRRRITLAEGAVPAERDFVLEWRPELGAAPEAALFAEEVEGESYLSVLVVPPAGEVAADAAMPRDLVFVVDTSGSMHGPSIAQAKAALLRALGRLRAGDRFNVIRFASDTHTLFRDLEPVGPHTLSLARAYVAAFDAEGGTNMLPALLRALDGGADPERLRQVVFLTDGAIGNEAEQFRVIGEKLGTARIFTVGIGSAPNGYFMRKAAELGRGSFTYIGNVEEVAARMGELFDKLARPALVGVSADWPAELPAAPEAYPAPIPDLYAGEPVSFSAKLPGRPLAELDGELVIGGWRDGRRWERRLPLAEVASAPGAAAIWARAKIDDIEDALYRGAERKEVRAEALAVALRHRLVTRYTSLVAVDERPARPPEAPMASREIARNLPAGWSWEHVFGPEAPELELRPLPRDLLHKIKAVGQPGAPTTSQPLALPQTATPAELKALFGLGLLLAGLALLVAARRGRCRGPAGA